MPPPHTHTLLCWHETLRRNPYKVHICNIECVGYIFGARGFFVFSFSPVKRALVIPISCILYISPQLQQRVFNIPQVKVSPFSMDMYKTEGMGLLACAAGFYWHKHTNRQPCPKAFYMIPRDDGIFWLIETRLCVDNLAFLISSSASCGRVLQKNIPSWHSIMSIFLGNARSPGMV